MDLYVNLKNGKTRVHFNASRWLYDTKDGTLEIYRMVGSVEKMVTLYSSHSWDYVEAAYKDSGDETDA